MSSNYASNQQPNFTDTGSFAPPKQDMEYLCAGRPS